MILMPIVYARDMDESAEFYSRLGFEIEFRSPTWTQLKAGDGAILALHAAEAGLAGTIELAMMAQEPLELIARDLSPARGIADEAFGRSLVLEDPNGLRIQINQHDHDLHGAR